MQFDVDPTLQPILTDIAARANPHDRTGAWPGDDLQQLAEIGAMRWAIPKAFGGDDLTPLQLQDRYELLAAASLATALIFTQRDAAVGFIEVSGNEPLKQELLPALASHAKWTTIGISHLTTSTQAGSLQAIRTDTGLRLNGMIPWSTGADHADFIVAGARVQDGNPVIFVLPTDRPGLRINAALPLATLSAAHTSSIECRDVQIESHLLLAGPSSDAMTARKRSVHVSQAFAALGLIRGALELLAQVKHGSASTALDSLTQQYRELRHSVHALNTRTDDHDLQSGPLIRSELNNLALRATHAAVTVHKGSSLRLDHPAQRLAREALFLLVWSSPMSVVDRNLELMSEPI
ncbi:MAG: acyl-CoA dehydrogenase family protein [Tepidisphaeraceae bacterium]